MKRGVAAGRDVAGHQGAGGAEPAELRGGRDLWGLRDPQRDAAKGWQTPIFNDGVIEVRSFSWGL